MTPKHCRKLDLCPQGRALKPKFIPGAPLQALAHTLEGALELGNIWGPFKAQASI